MPKKKVFVARNEMLDDEWVGNLLCVSASFFVLQEELRRGGGWLVIVALESTEQIYHTQQAYIYILKYLQTSQTIVKPSMGHDWSTTDRWDTTGRRQSKLELS